MRIGVDIDGVLINSQALWRERGLLFNKYNNLKLNVNDKEFEPCNMFGWDDNLNLKFWKEYSEDYYRFCLPSKKAIETLNKFKEEGHEIFIITNRLNTNTEHKMMSEESLVNYTKEWLTQNEVPYDEIIFANNVKSKILLDNNCDIMIDDNMEDIKIISQVMQVICFKRPYNEELNNYNSNYKIYRTDDWNMIHTIIEYRLNR